jgi:hypothetical protein
VVFFAAGFFAGAFLAAGFLAGAAFFAVAFFAAGFAPAAFAALASWLFLRAVILDARSKRQPIDLDEALQAYILNV